MTKKRKVNKSKQIKLLAKARAWDRLYAEVQMWSTMPVSKDMMDHLLSEEQ